MTLLVVDAANVIGSRPDGWWRDRAGAAQRLRDALVPLAVTGLSDLPGPLEVVLVVEGKARGVTSVDGVRVVAAPGSGDDAIVHLVAAAMGIGKPWSEARRDEDGAGRSTMATAGDASTRGGAADRVVVVTADRGLRERVQALGAEVRGPRTLSPAY